MKLKVDSVDAGSREVETVGQANNPQVRVTISFHLKGLDLSESVKPSEDPDADEDEADRVVDEAKEQIRKFFTQYYNSADLLKEHEAVIGNDPDFVGLDCDVTIYGVENTASLKNLEADIEVHAFYDVPVRKLEDAIEAAKEALLGK